MATDANAVKLLNGLLTTELRAINQYFLDSKLAGHWGYDHLAEKLRAVSSVPVPSGGLVLARR